MQTYIPFVGPSYVYRSISFDAQRSINLYPTKSETGTSRTDQILVGTPGIKEFSDLSPDPIRGAWTTKGRAFFVSGNGLYEVFDNGSNILIGNLISSSGAVSLSDNGTQIIIVDGSYGYIFNLTTDVFVQITDADFPGAVTVTFIDGYFVINKPNSGQYYVSGLYDGLSWDALDFATAEGAPDNLIAVLALHQNIWLFGEKTVQIVYNSGGADFPFSPVSGAFIEYGCFAPFSVAKSANTAYWIGSDETGAGVVWKAEGYSPKRVSTNAIEYKLSQFSDLEDAEAYCYQEDGHFFYIINVPSADTSIVYDELTNEWHERAYFNSGTGLFEKQKQNSHIYCFNRHLVGSRDDGIVYEQSLGIYSDNGDVIKRQRISPHILNNLITIFYKSLQIDVEAGVGLSSETPEEDNDPQIMMRYSNDGGNTWSSERRASIGKIGQYKKRCRWTQLGSARDRVYDVSIASRCKINIFGAVHDFEIGNS